MSEKREEKSASSNNDNSELDGTDKGENFGENISEIDDLETALNDIEKALDNLETQNDSIFTRLKELDESNRNVRKELAETIHKKDEDTKSQNTTSSTSSSSSKPNKQHK